MTADPSVHFATCTHTEKEQDKKMLLTLPDIDSAGCSGTWRFSFSWDPQ